MYSTHRRVYMYNPASVRMYTTYVRVSVYACMLESDCNVMSCNER